jgi:hypothetical protein
MRGRLLASPSRDENPPQPFSEHLGWGSAPLTQALKSACFHLGSVQPGSGLSRRGPSTEEVQRDRIIDPAQDPQEQPGPLDVKKASNTVRGDRFVKLYPDLALAMLVKGVVAAGRIWLVLQFIDKKGCGWVSLATARKRLTSLDSDLHLCGGRQLRKLLARGDGLFWHRDKGRIWLRSVSKVASSLAVQKLTGAPVALAVDELLKGAGHARAHFYASFHSSRNPAADSGKQSRPIARSTIQRLSHVSRRSQQRYERRMGMVPKANMAVGGVSSIESDQRTAWKQGTAAFRFTDFRGVLGRKDVTYTAWQLPNNYQGPHEKLPKGKMKKINRDLAVLFMKGMTGNGKDSDPATWRRYRVTFPGDAVFIRRYHPHGRSAAASYSRSPDHDSYWPEHNYLMGSYQRWFLIPGHSDG